MNAKEEPRNTGLFILVKARYTSVPTPAPIMAADWLRYTPLASARIGTRTVAAIIANNCWNA